MSGTSAAASTTSAHNGRPPRRSTLRVAATLLLTGQVLFILVGLFHPDRKPANDHPAVFAEYAASGTWKAVHLGQFVGMAILLAGLLALFFALNDSAGTARWVARFGAGAAVAELALYGALQAVDGVALKQSVTAWVRAPDAEKPARFASAETIRWLEWGVRSYQDVVMGLALLLFAVAVAGTAWLSWPIAALMGLSGIAYLVQGWLIGAEGFSPAGAIPNLAAYALDLVWMMWLVVAAWRMSDSEASSPGRIGVPKPRSHRSPRGATASTP